MSKHLTSTTTYSPGSLILSTLLVNISRVEALGEREEDRGNDSHTAHRRYRLCVDDVDCML